MFCPGNENVAKLLIKAGIDINAKSEILKTAFHYSAENGRMKVADLLVKSGAELNGVALFDLTPYKLAEESGHTEIFEEMLKQNGKKVTDSLKMTYKLCVEFYSNM